MTAPLSDEQIAEMLDDCDNASAASLHAVCRHYVRALAAECMRLRDAAKAEAARLREELETLVRECLAAHEKVSVATIEEQKWRDSFFAAIAKRDTLRLALSAVAGDPCDEPYMDGHAPCGCCRSHIKTARRALDE